MDKRQNSGIPIRNNVTQLKQTKTVIQTS